MMKRTILHIMATVMLLAAFTACETESIYTTFGGGNARSIKLLLNAQGDEITRAVSRSDGNDAYGENTIATADVFFYNADGTLIYNVAKDNVTLSEPDANGVVTATVPMPSSDENIDLTQATKVYVMGNRQATDDQVAGAKNSEDALRALTFTTAALAEVPTPETTFAMDGTAAFTTTDNEISGTVELVRAAAKITLKVNLPSTLTADEKTYKPQTTGITVTFNKGVKTFGVETDMFNVEQRTGTAGTADAGGITPVAFEPFYSYPTTWETGDDNEPYFTLHVPWGETNAEGSVTSYTTYHYRVPINKGSYEEDGKTLALNRNHWYQIDLTVGVLGTPEASDYVEVPGNYEVKPWGNLPIGANLLDFKYLVVDQERVEIYNQNSASVAFASSHPVTLEIISIKKWDYSTEDGTELNYAPSSTATDKSVVANGVTPTNGSRKLLTTCEVDAVTGDNPNKGNIELKHDLINKDASPSQDVDGNGNNRDDYDYVYYTITVKVTNEYYTENITFIQYPEMYIEAKQNSGQNNTGTNASNGYVWVNNSRSTLGSVHGLTGGNTNPNMYVITTTVLADDSDFVIGDPRVKDYTDESEWSSNANDMNGTNRDLDYYYGTDKSSTTMNVIAPKFRIASSYGVTNQISYENARRRCASYQEDGYPAGRWRMPTYAEYSYIVMFSYNDLMPDLYTTSSQYWYAHGHGNPQTDGTVAKNLDENGNFFIRCVYDEWYWNDKCDKGTFTWGDQPR